MTKFERINLVKHLGLNTEDCILVKDESQLDNNAFLARFDSFSIRTQWPDDNDLRKTPHLAVVNKYNLKKEAKKLLSKGLQLLIKKCIDPKDCEFCGAALKKDNKLTIEIAVGPTTVRTVTHKNDIDFTALCTRAADDAVWVKIYANKKVEPKYAVSDFIRKVAAVANEFFKPDLDDVIFEFSWYKIPVGWKNERLIIWEITKSGYDNVYEMTKYGTRYNTLLWNRFE